MADKMGMVNEDFYKEKAKYIFRRMEDMKKIRVPWETLWEDIARWASPTRDDVKQDMSRVSDRKLTELYSVQPLLAVRVFTDGFMGYLMSQNAPWFRVMLTNEEANENPDNIMWLQHVESRLLSAIGRSNCYSESWACTRDVGVFGNGILYSEEDVRNKRLAFLAVHPGQIYFADDMFGNVDIVIREVKVEARQAYQRFGDRLSHGAQQMAKDRPYDEIELIHCVMPRDEYAKSNEFNTRMPWASYWLEKGSATNKQAEPSILAESGFRTMPYQIWRYDRRARDPYGVGPGATAYAAMKNINLITKLNLRGAHMAVDPIWNVPASMKGRVKKNPGDINFYDVPEAQPTPAMTGIQLPLGEKREEVLAREIEEIFFNHIFAALRRAEREKSATETIELLTENSTVIGPVIGRAMKEFLTPMLERIFDIEFNARRIAPPPPSIIEGGSVKFDFLGLLAQAQRRSMGKRPIVSTLEDIAPLIPFSEAGGIADNFDADGLARDIAVSNGFPAKRVRTKEEVAAIRQQKAEAAMQQAQMANAERVGAMANMQSDTELNSAKARASESQK